MLCSREFGNVFRDFGRKQLGQLKAVYPEAYNYSIKSNRYCLRRTSERLLVITPNLQGGKLVQCFIVMIMESLY